MQQCYLVGTDLLRPRSGIARPRGRDESVPTGIRTNWFNSIIASSAQSTLLEVLMHCFNFPQRSQLPQGRDKSVPTKTITYNWHQSLRKHTIRKRSKSDILYYSAFACDISSVSTVLGVQLAEDIGDMIFHSAFGEYKPIGNFTVACTRREEFED